MPAPSSDRQEKENREDHDQHQGEKSSSGEKEDGGEKNDGTGDGRDQKEGEEKKGFKLSKKAIVITAVILLVLIAVAVLYWLHRRNFVSTDDAYTTGHIHQVSARVSGIVTEVRVDDNQLVKAGEVLVRLDPRDYQSALQRARAGLEQARATLGAQEAAVSQAKAQLAAGEAQADQARSQVADAQAQLKKAQQDYDRVAGLFQRDLKAVSRADVDTVTASLEAARQTVEGARANLAAALARTESNRADIGAALAQAKVAEANISSAEAQVRNAELQLSYTDVLAPVDGKISRKTVETGQQLTPGQALLSVVPQDIWIIANLKETQLERVAVGQRVEIKIDSLPHYKFYGSVHSLQEGSGATFSLLPPDNATGNFTKIVQRIPIKIVFDPDSIRDFRDRIVPGLSVVPYIDLKSLEDPSRENKREQKKEKQNDKVEGRSP